MHHQLNRSIAIDRVRLLEVPENTGEKCKVRLKRRKVEDHSPFLQIETSKDLTCCQIIEENEGVASKGAEYSNVGKLKTLQYE